MWFTFIFLTILPEKEATQLFRNNFAFFLFYAFTVTLYMGLVLWVLPGLIFGDKYSGLYFYFITFAFAGLTSGIGPVIAYWLKVDKKLSDCIKKCDF